MKLVSKDAALAGLATVPDEVKPLRGIHLPTFFRAVAERYDLARVPSLEEAKSMGAKFQNGRFETGSTKINISELCVFNDALTVTTTDTADSEVVLNDLIGWLKETFGFRDQTTPPIRIYQSDLVVRFDNDPKGAFGSLGKFLDFVLKEMTPHNARSKKPVEFTRIAFGTDPAQPGASSEFTVERRVGVPWHLQLYFSKAHMHTAAHIRALEMLDELLGGRKS